MTSRSPAHYANFLNQINMSRERKRRKTAALVLADEIAGFPEMCMRADRRSAIAQWSLDIDEALIQEGAGGYEVATTEAVSGAARFSSGAGRHGSFDD